MTLTQDEIIRMVMKSEISAICTNGKDVDSTFYTDFQGLETLARLAYEQGRKDAIPEGWQLVPKEPTAEIVKAMKAAWLIGDCTSEMKTMSAYRVFFAMPPAAPEVKP